MSLFLVTPALLQQEPHGPTPGSEQAAIEALEQAFDKKASSKHAMPVHTHQHSAKLQHMALTPRPTCMLCAAYNCAGHAPHPAADWCQG